MTQQKWIGLVCYGLMVLAALLVGGTTAQIITWIFIALAAVHLLEFAMMFKLLSGADGSMPMHFLQTLLFGFIHWKPLKDQGE